MGSEPGYKVTITRLDGTCSACGGVILKVGAQAETPKCFACTLKRADSAESELAGLLDAAFAAGEAKEREACEEIAEDVADNAFRHYPLQPQARKACEAIAEIIRARGGAKGVTDGK